MTNQSAVFSLVSLFIGSLMTMACSADVEEAPKPPPSLRAELERLGQISVFFGHQSVGWNILGGLQRLAEREGVPLQILEAPSALGLQEGSFRHHEIAYNGAPEVKIASFEEAFTEASGPSPSVALMKFCYVDFSPDTDNEALLSKYRDTVAQLQREHPNTTFVHVTVPLTAEQSFFKTTAKRLMGRATSEEMNAKREAFNELMREAYEGREPLFDLARIESTRLDGSRLTTRWDAKDVPMLDPVYTHDGEHLNEVGSERAAIALVELLADLELERDADPTQASQ